MEALDFSWMANFVRPFITPLMKISLHRSGLLLTIDPSAR
jgi:hypothetical protein